MRREIIEALMDDAARRERERKMCRAIERVVHRADKEA